jgi:hypothetical protein
MNNQKMKNHTTDVPKSGHDRCCGFTGVDTTQPSEDHGPTDRHSKTICKCWSKEGSENICAALKDGQKGADAMASTQVFVVMATSGELSEFIHWVVAVHENELDANDHCVAAQAVADKVYEDYRNGLIEDDDLFEIENEYDPGFTPEPEKIRYAYESYTLFKTGQGIEAVKK